MTYQSNDLPLRQPASVKEHVEAYKLGLPIDQKAAMSLLQEQKARTGTLNDEGVVLLAAALRYGADPTQVARLHPGEAWMSNYSNRLRVLPDSGYGHSFVLREGRVAVADDQAMACAAAEAMAELSVGLVSINDSHQRRAWTQQEARKYDNIAKTLKADFQVSFRNADGTFAEALNEYGQVVETPADAHAWWMINGIGTGDKAINPTSALRRLVHGDGRNSDQALAVLRLVHDLKLEPCVPDNFYYYNGRLPHGIQRVVVDGVEAGSAAYRLSLTESRSGRSVHLDASKGYGTLLAKDVQAEYSRSRVATPVTAQAVAPIAVPAQNLHSLEPAGLSL